MEKFSESQHSSSKPRVSTAHINYISFQTRMPRILVNQNQNENINLSDLDIQRIVNFLYYQLNKTGKNIHKFNVVLKKMNNLVCVMHFGLLFHFPNKMHLNSMSCRVNLYLVCFILYFCRRASHQIIRTR